MMVLAYKRAEVAYPPMFGDDFQMWRFVELEEHRPWFYVMINRQQKAAAWRTMLLIPTEEELEHILEKRTAGTLIEAVQVVLPARRNGANEWTMERLVELVKVYGRDEREFWATTSRRHQARPTLTWGASTHGTMTYPIARSIAHRLAPREELMAAAAHGF